MKWIALIVASGFVLAAGPASAAVGLVAAKGEPLRRVEISAAQPGLLTSVSTRIPGLIAAADLAHPNRLGIQQVAHPELALQRLKQRFAQIHSARRWSYVILAAFTIGAILIGLWRRTPFWARFCVAIGPVVIAVNLVLGLAGAARPEVVLSLLALGSLAVAAAIALTERLVLYLGPAILVLFLVILWAWPETAGFAAIGPRPEQGSRFYGINNMVETILLTITLFSAAELGLASILPIGALALVTLGWSKTGADGGGLIVFAVALAFLALRLAGRITIKRIAIALGICLALVVAFIGVDKASGGHDHVTRAFDKGPSGWFGDIGHRIHLSLDGLNQWDPALMFAISIAALVWVGLRRPRYAAIDALLLGVAVSFLVNDTAREIAPAGAISAFVLWTWAVTRYTRARALDDPDSGGGDPRGGRLR